MSPRDLEAYNIYEGRRIKLEFEGDITVDGEVITGTRNLQGKILIIAFKNCTVKHKEEILFHPDWGIYHMAVGKKIVSAYAGPADYTSFDLTLPALSKRIPAEPPNEEKLHLFKLYKKVRNIREGKLKPEKLNLIFEEIGENFTSEWLLLLEILEIAQQFDNQKVIQKTQFLLNQFQKKQPNLAHFVNNELALVE
jgi:phenylalanine-4-hydroxylase